MALLIALLAVATGAAPTAHAQTVRDSVRIDLVQVNTSGRTEAGNGFCGASAQALWPNVLQDLLGTPDRSYGYSDYTLVATEGQFVPSGRGQIGDLPDGILGHDPQIGGSQFNFNPDGPIPNCAPQIAAVALRLSGAWGFRNARPFRVTDWYAVYSIPSGTPVALFEWAQTEGFTVEFDGFAPDLSLSREVDASAPGGKRPVVAYAWDFGDGSTARGPSPRHTYEEEGTYEVTLTVTDDDGEENARTETVTVEAARLQVTVEATPSEVNVGERIDLVATVTNVGTAPVFDVEVGRVFTAELQLPEAENLEGRQFGGQSVEPVALADGEPAEQRRDRLAPGESVEVSRSYLVERAYGVREGFSGPYDPLEVLVNWKLNVVVGADDEGEPVPVADACEEVGSCPDSTRILQGPLVVRPAVVTREASRGDTLVVRATVENTGAIGLRDVLVPAAFSFEFAYADTIDASSVSAPRLSLLDGEGSTTLETVLAPGEAADVDVRYVVDRAATIEVEVEPGQTQPVQVRAEVATSVEGVVGFTGNDDNLRIVAREEDPLACPFEPGQTGAGARPRAPRCLGEIKPGFITLKRPLTRDSLFAVGQTYQIEWENVGAGGVRVLATTKALPSIPDDFTIELSERAREAALVTFDWEVKEEHTSPNFRLLVIEDGDGDEGRLFDLSPRLRVRDTTRLTRTVSDEELGQTYEYFEPRPHAWRLGNVRAEWFPDAAWRNQDSLQYRFDLSEPQGYDPNYGRAGQQGVRYSPLQFREANPQVYPAFVSLAHAFGNDETYHNFPQPTTIGPLQVNAPKNIARQSWRMIGGAFGGACYGMSLSTAGTFIDPERGAAILGGIDPHLYQVRSAGPRVYGSVNALQLYQFGIIGQPTTAAAFVEQLRALFAEDTPRGLRVLGVFGTIAGGGGQRAGHAVLPYRVEEVGADRYHVYVYDPNFPGEDDRFMQLDTQRNTYFYASGDYEYATVRSGKDMQTFNVAPDMYAKAQPIWRLFLGQPIQSLLPEQGGPGVFLQARTQAFTLTTPESGHLVLADSVVQIGIDGAEALQPLTGTASLPYGYRLPEGTYSLSLDAPAAGEGVLVRRGNAYVGVDLLEGGGAVTQDAGEPASRSARGADGAVPASLEVDLEPSGGVQVRAGEGAPAPLALETTLLQPAEAERAFRLETLLPEGERITTALRADSTALQVRASSPVTYRLVLTDGGPTDTGVFVHDEVTLEGGSVHTIRPPWGDLNGTAVEVDIDRDGDGTVDETRQLENEVAVASDPASPTATLPEVFALKTYPNPTRGAATVDVALPEAADVRAEVYDLLGRRVVTLHDGPLTAGTHALELDTARLPAGVYVVRAVTPDATLTRRVTVVR
ncbi:MAG: PKD domain-containing protein [Bacteroidota bacterium]